MGDLPLFIFASITERKQAEENLRITASVFVSSQEEIMITDANNFLLDVNPAFTQLTGYTREEVIGKNPKLLSSGRQDKSFYASMWKSLEENKSWRGEIWNLRKSGEIYDEVLIEVAKRIRNTIRGGDTVARLGGDEFVVLLPGLEHGEESVATLERLLTVIALPITINNKVCTVGASIGVSFYPKNDENPDILLRYADQAMYVAKQTGKGRFHFF